MAETPRQIIKADNSGAYDLSRIARENIESVDIIDIDMLIRTKDGQQLILPEAGLAAMTETPPAITFADGAVAADQLLKTVSTTLQPIDLTSLDLGSADLRVSQDKPQVPQEEVEKRIKEAVEKAVKQAQAEFEQQKEEEKKEEEEEKERAQSPDSQMSSVSSLTVNTESSVEQMVEKVQQLIENLYSSNYDYVPPHEFRPPPQAMTNPPGVPAPISLTPVLTLFTGNVTGNEVTTSGSTTYIYGGGGALNSGAAEELGPRNALQFSVNEITGTAGNDVIYAQGNSRFLNDTPATDISHYAKEILLNVAGYFITLDDVVVSNVPSNVTIEGATQTSAGTWVLSADYVKTNQAFAIIYDVSGVTSETEFDITFNVTGLTTRAEAFNAIENFRFRYVDVTSVDQVTDPTLVYSDGGRLKEIYILPTSDQPNLINAGSGGNDTIYGGKNADTIIAADGNITVHTRAGADNVTLGNGNNYVSLDDGNSTLVTGNGANTITGGNGDIRITAGTGGNSFTLGDGNSTIASGSGNDTLIAGTGDGVFNLGGGNNAVTVAGGANVITTGSGNDTLVGGTGDDRFRPGVGNDSIVGNGGTNTLDYSTVTTTGLTISLTSGTATGTGVNTTFSNIQNVTGSTLNDSITGTSGNNLIRGGAGNDTIYGNGGDDTLYGDAGDDYIVGGSGIDLIYGGAGNDTINGGGGSQDTLVGGAGSDLFLNPTAGTTFYGTDVAGTPLATTGVDNSGWASDTRLQYAQLYAGEINVIDFTGTTGTITLSLISGAGSGAAADLNFGYTSDGAQNSINGIIGNAANNTITGSNADDYLHAGTAGTNSLNGGLGDNTLVGSASGTTYFVAGTGTNTIVAGSTASTNHIYYDGAAEVVMNLTGVTQTYVESNTGLTKTVAAWSGAGGAEGDYYTPINGTNAAIDYVRMMNTSPGATRYSTIFVDGNNEAMTLLSYYGTQGLKVYAGDNTASLRFYGYQGIDWFYGGNGSDDIYYLSTHNDIASGGGSILGNSFITNGWNLGVHVNVTYLDAYADVDGNGIADYIDRGVNLVGADGITYDGFSIVNNSANKTLLSGFSRLIGHAGNDFFVGDDDNNYFNALEGINTIYAMGGNDIIVAVNGTNIIDGGAGTDTLWLWHDLSGIRLNTGDASSGTVSSVTNYAVGVSVFLEDGNFLGSGSDKAATWGSTLYDGFQLRTGNGSNYPHQYSTVVNVENIQGSAYADILYGDSGANSIRGGAGNDTIAGNGGADSLYGDAGNDTFYIAASDIATVSVIDGGAHNAIVAGGAGWSGGGDWLISSGWTFTAGQIAAQNAKFVGIEHVNVRNGSGGQSYSLNQSDVNAFLDATGTGNVFRLYLDTGDTFTATGATQTATGTDATQGSWIQYDYGTAQRMIVYFG